MSRLNFQYQRDFYFGQSGVGGGQNSCFILGSYYNLNDVLLRLWFLLSDDKNFNNKATQRPSLNIKIYQQQICNVGIAWSIAKWS